MRLSRHDRGRWTAVVALALAVAAPDALAVFTVNAPWIRLAGSGAAPEAYMELRSSDGAVLAGVTGEGTTRVGIRGPGKDTAALDALPLPPGKAVTLGPGGYRLAITRTPRPLKLGDRVPLTLIVRDADGTWQDIAIIAEVRRRSPIDDELRAHKH